MVAFTLFEWLILGTLIFISMAASGTWAFIKVRNIRWNYNYVVWDSVGTSDVQEPYKKGKCRLIKIGDMGEEIFYLQKLKTYKLAYGKRVGKNTVYWTIGEDGLWYNTVVGNFNKNFKGLGLMPVERDVRMGTTATRKIIEGKYHKMDKTTQAFMIIVFILLIVALGVAGLTNYITYSKYSDSRKLDIENSKLQNENSKLLSDIINKMDILRQGGAGYTTVP